MARIQGISDEEAGFVTGRIFAVAARSAGHVPDPLRIMAKSGGTMWGAGRFQMAFDLVSADNQELVAFVKRAKVAPGRYCVRARRWTMFLRGSDMQMSDTACFDAEGGHIYRIRRRGDGFAIIDRKDPTVVSLVPAKQT